MRERPRSLRTNLHRARLYRDDAEEIIKLMEACGESVTFESGDYEFESLAELQTANGEVVKEVRFCGKHVSLTMAGHGLELAAYVDPEDEESPKCENAFHRIKELVAGRERWDARFMRRGGAFGIFAVCCVLICAMGAMIGLTSNWWLLLPYALLILVGFKVMPWLARTAVASESGGGSSLVLVQSHEATSFWKRNHDAIMVSTIVAVISGVLSFFAGWSSVRVGDANGKLPEAEVDNGNPLAEPADTPALPDPRDVDTPANPG